MSYRKLWFFLLFVFLFCFLGLSNTALSENGWIRSLKNTSKPGRIMLHPADIRQKKATFRRAVHMKHSSFLLDQAYIPHILKKEGHILLQLTQPLDVSIKENLEEHGVELQEYIDSNTWKTKIPAAAVNAVKDLDFVDAMGDIHPVDKFPDHALEKDFNAYSYHSDGTISILVTFHGDIPFYRVREILTDLSGTTDQEDFIAGQRALLSIPQDQLQALAESDEVSWIEDRPPPRKGHNIDAAALSKVDSLQALPYGLDGFGVAIGEWDVAEVQDDHPDFSGRITIVETSSVHSHSTHVAGTMIGNGSGSADAKGMAPAATLYSYDFYDDVTSEMSTAVSTYGIELSSNSWGPILGWQYNYYGDNMDVWFGDSGFGDYASESRAWDQTVVDTDLIIVKSAGNDRNNDGDQSLDGHHHVGDSSTVYSCSHPPDGAYDCVDFMGAAKNIITVGAVSDSGAMLSFSSWGPVDDGRIKPDIVANGYSLSSTCPTNTYCNYSGTSMSTPVVTGAIALIIERYVDVFGVDPSAAMVKALLITTAVDKGNTGPDYSYGWGLLDAKAAVTLVDGASGYVMEDSISSGEILEYPVSIASSGDEIKMSIAWTDRAGSTRAASALVNDIDLELVDPSTGIHRPWILDPDNPSMAATTGINSVDNVEQIVVSSPEPGDWLLRVHGASIQGAQTFALAVKMPAQVPGITTSGATETTPDSYTLNGYLDSLGTASAVDVSFEWGLDTGYGNETTPQTLTNTDTFSDGISGLSPGTTYHFRAKAVGDGIGYGNDIIFTTSSVPPTATTAGATSVTTTSATLNGSLEGMGTSNSVDVTFEWGLDTGYGNETTPQSLASTGAFNANISGLSPDNTYHFRTKAVGDGIDYGNDLTFTTDVPPTEPPLAITGSASGITTGSATLNGSLNGLGTADLVDVTFEWGLDTGYGNETTPQSLASTGVFNANISGLSPGTTYHFRAKAVGDGIDYGNDMAFATSINSWLSNVSISIDLEGSNRPDPEGWEIPVTIGFFTPGADVLTDTPIYEFHPTTSKGANTADCTVTEITPGTYDITVVSAHTLMNVQRNVTISGTSTSVYMGTLLEGDCNQDHVIDVQDYYIIYMPFAYGACEGDTYWNSGADLDRSGCIDVEDYNLYSANMGKSSPIELTVELSLVDISIDFQGSNRPDPEGWEIPVTIGFFTPGADVLADTPVYEFHPTTDKGVGLAFCQVTGIAAGTYDITVMSEHTLMNVKRNVSISGSSTSVYMGTLLEGDCNQDHVIDVQDYYIIYMPFAYGACEGDTYWNSGADLDRSGCIDVEDYNLYSVNKGKSSPIEIP